MNPTTTKAKENDVFYARYFMRHLSRPFVPLAVNLGLSPNGITLASIATGLIALVYLLRGTISGDLTGLLILQFSFWLDCLDGDVARARLANSTTDSANIGGAFLDYSRELIIPPLVHLSLAVGLHNVSPALPLVYLAAVSSMLKLAPQLAKEHTVIAQLRKADANYLETLQNGPVLHDSFANVKKQTTPVALALRLAKSIFGFPGGLINSMMVIVAAGWLYGPDIYIAGKTALLWTATGLYLLNFLFTYGKEFRQLRQVPPSQNG